MPDISKVALFTNEYPPHVYGGAGVHVEYLGRELSHLVPVEDHFSWTAVAHRTLDLYKSLLA